MLFNTLLAGAAILSGVTQVTAFGPWNGDQSLQGSCSGYLVELEGRPQCADQSKAVAIDAAQPASFGISSGRFSQPGIKFRCPINGHWWAQPDHRNTLFCCTPKPNCGYPPRCPPGYEWNGRCCVPCETPPTPSRKPHQGGHHGKWKKRDTQLSFDAENCPEPLSACSIPGVESSTHCVDTQNDIDNCGGCVSSGKGVHCETLPGVYRATCTRGECQVLRCLSGYRSVNGTSCVPQ